MSYLPKHKYQIKKTGGHEFQYEDGRSYSGPYIQTSNGAFAGSSPYNLGPRLHPKTGKRDQQNNILEDENTHIYFQLNKRTVNFIKKTEPIVATKTKPTKEDYDRGYMIRFFAQKVNNLTECYEINSKNFQKINYKVPQYDHFSYTVGSMIWTLDGNPQKANLIQLKKKNKKFPNISRLFPDLSEFSLKKIINNQYANQGELVFKDNINREYIGPYHIHPDKGPMVGNKHTLDPHPQLIFVKDLNKNTKMYTPSNKKQIFEFHGHTEQVDDTSPEGYAPPPIIQSQIEKQNLTIPSQNQIPTIPSEESGY